MTHVIIVNGKPRAGKDTFVEMVTAMLRSQGTPTESFSSIDPVRNLLSAAGFDLSQKTEADRKLLAVVGSAVEEHSTWRTRQCLEAIEEFRFAHSRPGLFFLHMREPKNIEAIRNGLRGGARLTTVIVDNDRVPFIISNDADRAVFEMQYDYLIPNHGALVDLQYEARLFLARLLK